MNRIEHNKLMGFIEEVRMRKKGESEATRFIDQLLLCVSMMCEYDIEELYCLREMVSIKKKYQNRKERICENIDKAREIIVEARKREILPSRVYEEMFEKKTATRYDPWSNKQVFDAANEMLDKYRWTTIDGKIALGEKPKFRKLQNLLFYEWKKKELKKVVGEIKAHEKRNASLSKQISQFKKWYTKAEAFGAKKAELKRAKNKMKRMGEEIESNAEIIEELKHRKNEIDVWIDELLTNYYLILPETVIRQPSFVKYCKSRTKYSKITKMKRTYQRVK